MTASARRAVQGLSVAVRCRQVVKTYGSGQSAVRALRGVDLDVHTGELLMLVGPSGCGKTTLISVIAGVLDRDGGECSVLGQDYAAMRPDQKTAFRARHVGFVFQAFNLIPTLTIAENVSVPLLINGVPRKQAVEQAREMLSQVGIGDRWRDVPARLSGGQQQRVAIARALIHKPKLLVCDEPTSALDHVTGQRVMELLRGVASRHDLSLVVVTHDQRIFSSPTAWRRWTTATSRISGKGHTTPSLHRGFDAPRRMNTPQPTRTARLERAEPRAPIMIRIFLIPLLAIAGMVMAAYTVVQGARPPVPQPPVIALSHPSPPLSRAGIIETSSQNIAIGSPVGAVVALGRGDRRPARDRRRCAL